MFYFCKNIFFIYVRNSFNKFSLFFLAFYFFYIIIRDKINFRWINKIKIGVIAANGRVGSLVVKEAIEREHDITAIAMIDEAEKGNNIGKRISVLWK